MNKDKQELIRKIKINSTKVLEIVNKCDKKKEDKKRDKEDER